MRMCLVSPLPPPFGGIAVWTESIIKYSRWPESMQFISVDTAVRWRSLNNMKASIRVIGGSLQAVRDTLKLLKTLVVWRPVLVHLCTSGSFGSLRDIAILFVCRMFTVPSVLHVHMGRLPAVIVQKSWEWRLIRHAMLNAAIIVVLDTKSESEVHKSLPEKVVKTIPNPIDMEMVQKVLSGPPSGGPGKPVHQIAYVGQVIPSKGIRELVRACRSIDGFAFRLNLVGNIQDHFRAELMSLAADGNQTDWLQFHGIVSRERAMACIRDADIFVLPSYTEGFPLVVLEAMALGRPIIATNVGAIPEMLGQNTDTPCGVLIKSCDVGELHEAIVDLLSNRAKAEKYGKQARAKVLEQYSSDKIMKSYFDLWESLTVS